MATGRRGSTTPLLCLLHHRPPPATRLPASLLHPRPRLGRRRHRTIRGHRRSATTVPPGYAACTGRQCMRRRGCRATPDEQRTKQVQVAVLVRRRQHGEGGLGG
ncbi:hypothetical protein VPH35_128603 [Triticum aestivum]